MDRAKSTSAWLIMGIFSMTLMGCQKSTKEIPVQSQIAANDDVAETKTEYKKAALVNVELGLGYLSQGQIARAKTKLTHAMKLAPNIAETHTAMAHFLEKVGDIKEAEKAHKKALRYGSKSSGSGSGVGNSAGNGAVYNNYGAFLCRMDRLKETDDAFKSALEDKKYARTAEVYENAGVCALKGPTPEKGAEYLLNAIRQDPKRTTALLELTNLNLQQNNLQAAKSLLQQYKHVTEPTARSLWLGIKLSHALKDENSVASQVLMLKNIFENSPEYQEYLKSEISGEIGNEISNS